MARPRWTVARPDAKTFRSWTFVLVMGVLLAVIAIIDRGGLDALSPGGSACQVEATADNLNVRNEPSLQADVLDTLDQGEEVEATRNVVDGYRELDEGRWAADRYLSPVSGAECS